MASPVIAIGLDATEPAVLEGFMDAGELPFLESLRDQGTYARHQNFAHYATENGWLTLLQGCSPESSHEWGHLNYSPGEYSTDEAPAYVFRRYPPFYAGLPDRKVAIFDLPLVDIVDGVDGIQAMGWGTEANQILRRSQPEGVVDELVEQYGAHPLYTLDQRADGMVTLSAKLPSLYDMDALNTTRDRLIRATRQRTEILLDIQSRGDWDLLLGAYGEVHSAGHMFWHLGRQHPLQDVYADLAGSDYLLTILKEADHGLQRIAEAAPDDATLIVFSPHGMRGNSMDLYSMLFLPELLYRWSTGQEAFANSAGEPLPPPRTDYRRHWSSEVWDMTTQHGRSVLESPAAQDARKDPLYWEPSNWYCNCRKSMKAFPLPGYSEGLVRINVAGRDGPDGISPDDYDRVCKELISLIGQLRDSRDDQPLAERIVRTRTSAMEEGHHLSPADLLVVWKDTIFTDCVDHPELGRIGPAPHFRSGGHATGGFVIGRGSAFPAGSQLEGIDTADVTATMLDLLEVAIPEHIAGTSLCEKLREVA